MSSLSGFRNIWMGEGKSVYHGGDHKGRQKMMMSSSVSGFLNIWMGEGKSVYHDGDHNGRLL